MITSCVRAMWKSFRNDRLRKRFPQSVIYDDVSIGPGCELGKRSVLFHRVRLLDSSVGAYTYIQASTNVYNTEIGPFCSISGDVIIGLAAHPTTGVSMSPVFYDNTQPLPHFFTQQKLFSDNLLRTTIEADVWIGQGVMIKAGVRIGVGAVIGAGAIVTKDVPAYTIAAGNPCRQIRRRFSEDISQQLLDSCWWKFDDQQLSALAPYFHDPESFLAALNKIK